MFVSVLLLLGAGVVMASLTDSSTDQDVDSQSDEVPEPQDVEETLDNSQFFQNSTLNPYVELEGPEEHIGDLPVRENFEGGSSRDIFRIDITSANSEDSSDPLADFNSNPNMPILELEEFEYIKIDLDPEDGSIRVLRADYFERSDSNDGSESESVHSGANFYFVPNGEQFPEDYVWSRDGAALHNEQSNVNSSSDFGGIRIILRVDTGFLYNASSYEEGVDFSEEMFERLEEVIISSENVHIA